MKDAARNHKALEGVIRPFGGPRGGRGGLAPYLNGIVISETSLRAAWPTAFSVRAHVSAMDHADGQQAMEAWLGEVEVERSAYASHAGPTMLTLSVDLRRKSDLRKRGRASMKQP